MATRTGERMPATASRERLSPGAGAAVLEKPRDRHPAGLTMLLGMVLVAIATAFATGGSSEPSPATAIARLMPANTLLYVHVSTDSSRPAVRRWQQLMKRLPDQGRSLSALTQRMIAVAGGSPTIDYARDIRPWIGKEAGFAVPYTPGVTAGSVLVFAVRDQVRAEAFIHKAGATAAGRYRGTKLYAYATGAELAFTGGSLVVGDAASVGAVIDVSTGHAGALAGDAAYRKATADEPAGRVLDLYVSKDGVDRLLAPQQGLLGELGALVAQPGLLGSAISVSPGGPGLRVHVHKALATAVVPDRGRLTSFSPSLQNVLPGRTSLMIDARNLSTLAPLVLRATSKIGLLSRLPVFLHRLGVAFRAHGGDPSQFLALFKGETAFALMRVRGTSPFVIVARTTNESAALATLGGGVGALEQVFAAPSSGPGIEPVLSDVQTGGVTAQQLKLGPGLEIDYAVFRGLIVLSSSLTGIRVVASHKQALADTRAYRQLLGNRPGTITSVGYADFSQFLSLAEQSRLAQSTGFSGLLPDLKKVRAVGLYSTRGETDTTAELFLGIP